MTRRAGNLAPAPEVLPVFRCLHCGHLELDERHLLLGCFRCVGKEYERLTYTNAEVRS